MDIIQILKTQFPNASISYSGEDCSSKLEIITEDFEGLNSVKRHQLILGVLKEHFQSGELHALSLSTKTPSEV